MSDYGRGQTRFNDDGSHGHPNLLDEWELCTDLKCPANAHNPLVAHLEAEVERLRADNEELHQIAEQATQRAMDALTEVERLRAKLPRTVDKTKEAR